MNTNRMINMAMRMLMRFGIQWMKQKNRKDVSQNSVRAEDRRQYRGKQPDGDAAKRMRSLKRLNKF